MKTPKESDKQPTGEVIVIDDNTITFSHILGDLLQQKLDEEMQKDKDPSDEMLDTPKPETTTS